MHAVQYCTSGDNFDGQNFFFFWSTRVTTRGAAVTFYSTVLYNTFMRQAPFTVL